MNRAKKKSINRQGQVKIQLNPGELPAVQCECGNDTFIGAKRIRKLSAFHPNNPEGKDMYIHQDIVLCSACKIELPSRP